MDKITEANLNTLANANELAMNIIMNVAGEEVSNSINGEQVRPADLRDAISAKMQNVLTKKTGVL